ncbi:MAG: PAS domain S-box protein [Prolixibacteraceae bacterium]|jgi:PAS domain S-box-containing protein|nr:PAS domain S-box protein [Prolixibacteraceae bacterium]
MKSNILELIDFEKVNTLLEGFNKSTGFVTAILDLEGNVLSKSGWRKICTNFHRVHPDTAEKCKVSDTVLAGEMAAGEKYHFYKCKNGLIDVAVPIIINDEHVANLFSGQFFFEKPDLNFFKKQAGKYKFDNKTYLEALSEGPVVSEEKVKTAMDFLLEMTLLISEMTQQKIDQVELNKTLKKSEERWKFAIEGNGDGLFDWNVETNEIFYSRQWTAMLGFEEDEIENKFEEWDKRVHPDDKTNAYLDVQKHLDGDTNNYMNEHRLLCKDGSYIWVLAKGKIISRTKNDKPKRFIGTHRDITEQKETEEQFRTIFEQSASGMCLTGLGGKLIRVNQPLCEMLGYDKNELEGLHFNSITFPDDIDIGAESVKKMLAGESKKVAFEKRYLTKSGEIIWVRINSALLRTQENNPLYFITQIENITQRVNSDIHLRTSENKFKALVEQSLTGIYIFNKDGFIYVNNRFCEIFGYSEEEVLSNLKPTDVIAADDRKRADKNVDKRLKGEVESVRYSARGNHKMGKELWVEIHGTHIEFDGDDVITGTVLDITERRQLEEEMEESLIREQLLADIVRESSVGIAIGYPNGRLGMCNTAYQNITGYDEDELKSIDWNKVLTPPEWEESELAKLQEIHATKQAVQYEKEYIRKDGTRIPIELLVNPRFDEAGEVEFYFAFVINITERKQTEKKLKERNEYIESIMENMPIGFAVNTIDDGDVKYMNNNFEEIYGWPREILTNTSLFFENVFPDPEYRSKMTNRIITDMQSGDPEKMIWKDLKIFTAKGEERYVHAFNIPLINQNLMISTVQDTTTRKLAEDELLEHREHLEELVKERTKNLDEKNSELERINKLFVGRELRMKELKGIIKELKEKLENS